jgi:hypothetical protein
MSEIAAILIDVTSVVFPEHRDDWLPSPNNVFELFVMTSSGLYNLVIARLHTAVLIFYRIVEFSLKRHR